MDANGRAAPGVGASVHTSASPAIGPKANMSGENSPWVMIRCDLPVQNTAHATSKAAISSATTDRAKLARELSSGGAASNASRLEPTTRKEGNPNQLPPGDRKQELHEPRRARAEDGGRAGSSTAAHVREGASSQ